jgi:2-succinyl-5-enolpyruvyl-6-hydroxy-3-cyclohexene-1-carboxylate synthase
LRNRICGRLLIEALARHGCRFFSISPGSRSTPLTLAAADTTDVTAVINHDERGAAFQGLGYGCAGDSPAVLICTSGTAAANYLPAVAEADAAQVPLIVLTADRPPELQQCGANQTINQTDLFGSRLRWFRQLPCPDDNAPLSLWLTAASEACDRAQGPVPGPVQLNLPFREPLVDQQSGPELSWPALLEKAVVSDPDLRRWLDGDRPWRRLHRGDQLAPAAIDHLLKTISKASRPLIVAGAIREGGTRRQLLRLAEQIGCPIIADVQSGLTVTNQSSAQVVHHADLLLRSPQFQAAAKPDLVIQVGSRLVSKQLLQWLGGLESTPLLRFSMAVDDDPLLRRGEVVTGDVSDVFQQLVPKVRPAPWSLADWKAKATELLEASDLELSETTAARIVSRNGRVDRVLWLGSSQPVRDVDACAASGAFGNVASARGVSGIDGTISAALGFSRGCRAPVTALVGDLTALHDVNALHQMAEHPWPVCLIVINNDGGGIFSRLPVETAAPGHFETYFGTPHGRSFADVAKAFDLSYRQPKTIPQLEAALADAYAEGDPTLIEIVTDRTVERQRRLAIEKRFASLH